MYDTFVSPSSFCFVLNQFVKKTIGDHGNTNDTFMREIMAGDHIEDIRVSTFYNKKPYNGPSGRVLLDINGNRQEGYVERRTTATQGCCDILFKLQ